MTLVYIANTLNIHNTLFKRDREQGWAFNVCTITNYNRDIKIIESKFSGTTYVPDPNIPTIIIIVNYYKKECTQHVHVPLH